MNIRTLCTVTLAALAISGARAPAGEPDGRISVQARLNTRCVPHNGGTVYLHLAVDAVGFALPDRSYEPMNIAVVLDRSGSMADQHKLKFAKRALYELVDRLSDADFLSIVIYDDRIETLLPSARVADKQGIKKRISTVTPRGSTNLGGGLVEGFDQLARNFRSGCTNRVLLLSDGLANVGMTDPRELGRIAGRFRSDGISLSTIGVGLEYNENLMLALAEHGGGHYYFVESPSQLAAIFERELHDLRYIVARNARIEMTPGRGVELVDVIGCETGRDGSRISIPIGSLAAGDHRELCVELRVPEGSGTLQVVRGRLRTDNAVACDGAFAAEIRYSDDAAELMRGRDWEIQPKVEIALSTRDVERAMTSLDEGRAADAAQAVDQAAARLASSPALGRNPAAAPLIQAQVERLKGYAREMKDSSADARRLKKAVQYDNYEVQRTPKP